MTANLHDLLRACAQNPAKTAMETEGVKISYEQLYARAGRMAREAKNIVGGSQPGLLSLPCIKDAGLLTRGPIDVGLYETQSLTSDDGEGISMYAIDNPALLEQSLALAAQRSV